jgi:molecular chaperone HscB
MQQLEVREQLEEAVAKKDSAFLDSLKKNLLEKSRALQTRIGDSIDARKDFAGAVDPVRKLMFLQRIEEEVDSAYETIE